MEKIRKEFPVLRQSIYADTAGYGLLYDDLIEWRQEIDLDFLLKGSRMRSNSLKIEEETKKTIANFFTCRKEDVALVSNFSTGLNIFLDGLAANSKVLLVDGDYPSLNWPFESRGFQISYVKITENIEEAIERAIQQQNITVLALSVVQWLNGIKIDLDFLKRIKDDYPHVLIIGDGTQFLGTEKFNFENSAFDVLGVSAYKWLLAGYGSGFMMFKSDVEKKANIKFVGFTSAFNDVDNVDNIAFAKRFEPGHKSSLSFGSIKFSLDFMSQLGVDVIEKQIQELSAFAKTEFERLGLLENIVVQRTNHSSIFNIKGDNNLFKYLEKNDVVCSQRNGGIRLSFHFYNTKEDIQQIVKLINGYKRA